jgi:hypothetical protein
MRRALLFSLGMLSACQAPPVFATADPPQKVMSGRIEGNVVTEGPARGDVVLLLFDAQRLPPPYGFGRPLTFTTVKASDLFTGTGNGPFTAPFAFSLVAPGNYFIAGLVDTNADFIPFYSVTAGTNTGDVSGGSVDPLTLAPNIIALKDVATKVGVSLGQPVPVDRPVFQVPGGAPSATVGAMGAVVQLQTQGIDEDAIHEARPVFLAQLAADGVSLEWPKVVVRKIDKDNPLLDENDLDKNGVPDDPTKPSVVLAAGFDPTPIILQLVDGMGMPKKTPTPVGELTLIVRPQALDANDPSAPKMLSSVPGGNYAITVINPTGQTWRVPNELAPAIAASAGLPPNDSQAFILQTP